MNCGQNTDTICSASLSSIAMSAWTVADVARIMQRPERSVRRLLQKGVLKGTKTRGRFGEEWRVAPFAPDGGVMQFAPPGDLIILDPPFAMPPHSVSLLRLGTAPDPLMSILQFDPLPNCSVNQSCSCPEQKQFGQQDHAQNMPHQSVELQSENIYGAATYQNGNAVPDTPPAWRRLMRSMQQFAFTVFARMKRTA